MSTELTTHLGSKQPSPTGLVCPQHTLLRTKPALIDCAAPDQGAWRRLELSPRGAKEQVAAWRAPSKEHANETKSVLPFLQSKRRRQHLIEPHLDKAMGSGCLDGISDDVAINSAPAGNQLAKRQEVTTDTNKQTTN
jgi:hypothetical protein